MNPNPNNPAIPVVLAGCGAVSRFFYAPALTALEASGLLRVEALADPSPASLAVLAASFPRARQTARLEDNALSGRLVIVASPPKFHAAAALHALANGAAVLCEKPMANSVAEAETMAAAARESGALLAVGLYKRFFPACEALKGLIEQQPLGPLRFFTIAEGGKFGWQAASDSFFRKSVTPGGVLLDIGVHVLDLLLWWLGEPDSLLYRDDAMGGQEANCHLDLRYADGVYGEVRLSRDWPTRNEYHFFFERGVVRYKVNEANHLEIHADGMPILSGTLHGMSPEPGRLQLGAPLRTNPQSFIEQLRNVAAAVHGRAPLRVPGEEGVRSLRLIERCYAERAGLLDMPWLTPAETAAAEKTASSNP
ncbi:MAG: Gfo/Idh/MocA family oxidoreductase [Chthoniobacteraceae bacterium]|nr:Gfo/Idh/MocA family oxidoreductase [Chthoniobacteraceae bacterium]